MVNSLKTGVVALVGMVWGAAVIAVLWSIADAFVSATGLPR